MQSKVSCILNYALVYPHMYTQGPPDATDGYNVKPYIEGVHWKKGKVIGTGAFCTCHLSRDLENGTMFAVKQVSNKQLAAYNTCTAVDSSVSL